jgi:hypothetical protein
MNTPTLTIFANFRINNEERYQRMKNSFMSFKDINAQKWVINVRGSYKLKTILFLREQLGEKLYPHLMESGKGWFYDTRQIIDQIDTDYVLFWIEDHINLVDTGIYDKILTEMKKNEVDHMFYSWWHNRMKDKFRYIEKSQTHNLNIYNMSFDNVRIIEKEIGSYFYTVSVTSISSLMFFNTILDTNHPKIKRWSKETPFDFEKRSTDKIFLPIKLAIPKNELFASIDDDQGNIGYSLISRCLYKENVARDTLKSIEFETSKGKLKFFKRKIPTFLLNKIVHIYNLIQRLKYTLK